MKERTLTKIRKFSKWLICVILILTSVGSIYYQISPIIFVERGGRALVVAILAKIYSDDIDQADELRKTFLVGETDFFSFRQNLINKDFKIKDHRFIYSVISPVLPYSWSPFIYEKLESPHIKALDKYYSLDKIFQADSEYESMLNMGTWVGSRWDHGQDRVPGEVHVSYLNAIDVIKAGERGKKFWCEVAARVTCQVATALGWPCRLVSASKDGYIYDHAVAELWSNQFEKWFVIDTDFNIVLEVDGVPLSAYELCKNGPDLQKAGRIVIRHIGVSKPSLKQIDLIPYYAYVQIDLRNDWYTRRLRRGSPEGGDLATYYTTRDNFRPILTQKRQIEDENTFNWQVNTTYVYPVKLVGQKGDRSVAFKFAGYSPYYHKFTVQIDGSEWIVINGYEYKVPLQDNQEHSLKVRMMTIKGGLGPISEVKYKYN